MIIGDRMKRGGPIWKAMYERMNALINMVNALAAIVLTGQAPHTQNDTTNVVTAANAASGSLDSVGDLEKDLEEQYEAHIASSTHHKAADTTNVVTLTSVYANVKALADELKADYNLHHVYVVSSCHAGAGDPNAVTEADVASKAGAIALLNDIKTQYNLHLANVTSCHGAADTANVEALDDLESDATWDDIQAMADDLKTNYTAHIALVDSVHGAADAANGIAADDVGDVQTSVNAFLNELKGDLNAHMAEEGTSHIIADITMKVTKANATTLATSVTLATALKTAFNDHISRAAEVGIGPIPTLDQE